MKRAVSNQRSAVGGRATIHERAQRLAASRRHRGGFSLVELVVVIAIILLLMGLTLAVTTSLTRGSESRQTEDTLRLLDAAYQEWKATSDRDVSYGVNAPPPAPQYEIENDDTPDADGNPNSNDHELTDQLLGILQRNAQAKEMLARINPKFLGQHDPGELEVIDAWDTEILVIFPGRLWDSVVDAGTDPDPDGSIRTEFEDAYGVCPNRQVVFLSAGPDGKFGNIFFTGSGAPPLDVPSSEDNLSSQPLGDPRS